jgi:hypothetical protein
MLPLVLFIISVGIRARRFFHGIYLECREKLGSGE